MAAISTPSVATSYRLSQAELLKRLDPKGNVAEIAEILNESNDVVQDVVLKEGNLPTGDEQTIRTGLPDIYWKQMNRGVPASHSTVAQVVETCGMMAARSEVDVDVMNLNGYSAEFRRQEEKPFIEAMGQAFAKTFFYGDARKTSEGFTGLATRYSSLSAANAKNIVDCGGTGTNLSSIYIVGWGDNVYCPYPKGSKVGIQANDMGEQYVEDDAGNRFTAYCTDFKWNVGLMVKDWRYVVRIANINPTELINGTGMGQGAVQTGNNLLTRLSMAIGLIPRTSKTQLKMYMNGDVQAGLNAVAARTHSNVIKYMDATREFGAPEAWSSFMGIPMRRVDQIVNTESQVQ